MGGVGNYTGSVCDQTEQCENGNRERLDDFVAVVSGAHGTTARPQRRTAKRKPEATLPLPSLPLPPLHG